MGSVQSPFNHFSVLAKVSLVRANVSEGPCVCLSAGSVTELLIILLETQRREQYVRKEFFRSVSSCVFDLFLSLSCLTELTRRQT